MARWDDLRRAILAKDTDGTERIWFELLEADPKDPTPFIEQADLCARQTGGKRLASSLLGLLVDAFREKERWAALMPVYSRLAGYAPDDGTLRAAVIEAAEKAYEGRADLEVLLENSEVRGGGTAALESQVSTLLALLRIEEDAWVFHKSGWGVGKVVEYNPELGRCVIDFRERPGHEMDVSAAAKLLERLEDDDIRVQAVSDPRGLRKRAKEEPLEMVRQVLSRYGHGCPLRNVREALVPDAVATSTWSAWWKEAKKQALMDPRFDIGPGRDPRVEFHDIAQTDFRTQVDRAIKGQATAAGRQKAIRDMIGMLAGNEAAGPVLAEAVERELLLTKDPAQRVGWVILHAELSGGDPMEGIGEALKSASAPVDVVSGIADGATRADAARALVKHVEGGPLLLLALASQDDAECADVAAQVLPGTESADLFEELLAKIDARPAQYPNLYAWYLRGMRRNRWPERSYDAGPLVLRVLKVLDAVEYRTRRKATVLDKKAVVKLVEILTNKDCALARKAAEDVDENGARHLLKMLGQNRGLKARGLEKLQDVFLRAHPGAMKKIVEKDTDEDTGGRLYMTAAGMESLRTDLNRISNDEIPSNAKEIARAREFGDLKENAEYHAAREKQSMLQAKADTLKSDLNRAVEITSAIVREDAVSVGARVRLRDAAGGDVTYTLLGPPDADVGRGIINYLTPLGQALMGQAPGDKVRLEVEGEVRELEVLEIQNSFD